MRNFICKKILKDYIPTKNWIIFDKKNGGEIIQQFDT